MVAEAGMMHFEDHSKKEERAKNQWMLGIPGTEFHLEPSEGTSPADNLILALKIHFVLNSKTVS